MTTRFRSAKFSHALLLLCSVMSLWVSAQDPTQNDPQSFGVHIISPDAKRWLSEDSKIVVLANGFSWTEGPLWIEQGQYLLFSDIPNNRVYRYDDKNGVAVYLDPAGGTNWQEGDDLSGSNGLLLDKQGSLVLFQQGDRRVAVMDAPLAKPQPRFTSLASSYQSNRLNSPNDGVFTSKGELYFTDPPYGMKNGMQDERKQLPFQGVYLSTNEGELKLLDDTVSFPNGISLSPDEKTLYVAVSDPKKAQWLAYDVMPDGQLDNRRVFYDATSLIGLPSEQGYPDGMAVHSSGVIFATGPGGVWLFAPDGRVLAKIRTNQLTANCALSQDESMLYITADDYLMRIKLNSL